MKETTQENSDRYLDTLHSTTLRKLFALILLSGVMQVCLIMVMPIQLYISFVLAALFLLYGISLIWRLCKEIGHYGGANKNSMSFKANPEIYQITAKDWRKSHLRSRIREMGKKQLSNVPSANDDNVVSFKKPTQN